MSRYRREHAELLEARGIFSLPAFASKKAFLSEAQLRRVVRVESSWPEYGIYGARRIGACWLIAVSEGAWQELSALASPHGKLAAAATPSSSFSKTLMMAHGTDTLFFGYCEPRMLVLKDKPVPRRFVEAPFYADMEIERALLAGESDVPALYRKAIGRYNEEIEYWQWHWDEESCDGAPVTEAEAELLITTLIHNRDALRYSLVSGSGQTAFSTHSVEPKASSSVSRPVGQIELRLG
jgi:hypothetical protein